MKVKKEEFQKLKYFEVTFYKKDGTRRVMKASVDFEAIPKAMDLLKDSKNSRKNLPDKYMTVWDMEKEEFRVVNTEEVIDYRALEPKEIKK